MPAKIPASFCHLPVAVQRGIRFAEALVNAFTVGLLLMMIALVFVNVVLRYGFNSGISVSVELSRFAFVWIIYLGSVLALAHNQHLAVPLLYRHLSLPWRKAMARGVLLIMTLLSLIFAYGAFQQMQLSWGNVSPISKIPRAIFFVAGLLSALGMAAIALFKCLYAPDSIYRDANAEEGEV